MTQANDGRAPLDRIRDFGRKLAPTQAEQHPNNPAAPIVPPVPPTAELPPELYHLTMTAAQHYGDAAHRLTQLMSSLRGLILNNVLWIAEVDFGNVGAPDAGSFTRGFSTPFASVAVWNGSTHLVTIAAEGIQALAPTRGNGVARVNPGRMKCVPMVGTQLSLYGTQGDTVTVAVYANPQPPAGGDA